MDAVHWQRVCPNHQEHSRKTLNKIARVDVLVELDDIAEKRKAKKMRFWSNVPKQSATVFKPPSSTAAYAPISTITPQKRAATPINGPKPKRARGTPRQAQVQHEINAIN